MLMNSLLLTLITLISVLLVTLQPISSSAPLDATVVFSRDEGGYYCHRIPYLLRTEAGSLLALAEGRGRDGRASCDDFSGTDLVLKRSLDDGKSWSALQLLYSNSSAASNESNVVGNAAPVQDRSTGRIHMPFCRNNEEVWMTFSDDDGVTWATPTYQPHLTHADWKWIGLGPPGGIQLSTGRLLIPAYHTVKWKGDGCASHGHTLYSDDHGETWAIGSQDFGAPYLANECQAVELSNGSVLVNARTLLNHRVQVLSNDGGLTFGEPYVPMDLVQPLEGCEGSFVRDPISNKLYFSDPYSHSVVRVNMTIYESSDEGLTWQYFTTVDRGSVSYSSMQVAAPKSGRPSHSDLEILYERSNKPTLIFEPDEIIYWKVRFPK